MNSFNVFLFDCLLIKNRLPKQTSLVIFWALFLLTPSGALLAQDSQELRAERGDAGKKIKGEHPLVELMRARHSSLKPELANVHPRVFLTQAEIDDLKLKAAAQPELWQTALAKIRALTVAPAPPPAEERRAQNEVGLGIAEAAFVYKITGERKYLDAAKKYLDAAVSYDVWGYSYNKPNVDLAAGHLLYGMGWGYDLLYHDLTPAERDKYRTKLVRQAKLMFEFFKPKTGKTYAYSQNHTFIPIAGLAVAAYALAGEVPEAKDWAQLSRAIFDRVLATYSPDGYYYEGMEYWIFSTPWLVHYLDAHLHATGEDLYQSAPGLKLAHKYVAHATLPGGEFHFDFGDIYAGNVTRARRGDDYERERVGGHFRSNYNILYNLAARYHNPEAQGVAEWLRQTGQVNAEEIWTFIWFDRRIEPVSIEKQERFYYFPDHDVAYWRSGWDREATAFAFKCGAPEGHAAFAGLQKFPDWRLSSGHAHPDAGSFIIWSNGKYLTGDSGYAGVPLTAHHNTLLFDGRGQNREGNGHDVFAEIPYERLNKIKVLAARLSAQKVTILSDVAAAYEPEIGVKKFVRKFEFTTPDLFLITDEVELNQPQTITLLLHADNSIAEKSKNSFVLEPNGTGLLAEIFEPVDFNAIIEKNILTAPGKPGSVDKGVKEERGVRLAISNKEKTAQAKFVTRLRIIK